MHLKLPKLPAANAIATNALKLMLVLWVMLAVAAVFVMTLGTDEAWVLNGLRSALRPQVPNLSTDLIVTSGGPFALANLAVEQLAGSQVWLHRLVSLLCLGLCFALVTKGRISKVAPDSIKWLMLAPLIAIPGAAVVGTAALGTSTGLFLMVAAMVTWTTPGASLAKRVLAGGLLYGLAAASRFDLVLFGPAVLLASCLRVTSSGRLEVRLNLPAWVFVIIGAGVFLLNLWAMSLPANALLAGSIGAPTGLTSWSLNYPKLLNDWQTVTTFAPLSLLVLMAVSAFWFTPAPKETTYPHIPRFESLLLITGLVLLTGWLLRSPIPHLRYAFPALFCFAALGGIGLHRLATRSLANGAGWHVLLCQCIGLAFVIGSIGTTARSLVMSDSDYASWEWSHEMSYDYFRHFEARQDQAKVTDILRNELFSDARIYSYVPYALRYLTERPIIAVDRSPQPDRAVYHTNRYLVLTPAVGTYFYMNPNTANWIQANAKLVKQIGRYSVYQLPAGNDEDLENMKLHRTNYVRHPGSIAWFGHR